MAVSRWVARAALVCGVSAAVISSLTLTGAPRRDTVSLVLVLTVAVVALALFRYIHVLVPPPKRAAYRKNNAGGQVVLPAELVQLERVVTTATSNASDLHSRLRPVLRAIARERLRSRGIDLDSDELTAHKLLGDEFFELVRADRPRPDDPFAAGITRDRIVQFITILERI